MSKQFTKGQRVLVEGIILELNNDGDREHKVSIAGVGMYWIDEDSIHPAPTSQPEPPPTFQPDDRVQHRLYGPGRYIGVIEGTDGRMGSVSFDGGKYGIIQCYNKSLTPIERATPAEYARPIDGMPQPEPTFYVVRTFAEAMRVFGDAPNKHNIAVAVDPSMPTPTEVAQAPQVYADMERWEHVRAMVWGMTYSTGIHRLSTEKAAAEADKAVEELDQRFRKGGE